MPAHTEDHINCPACRERSIAGKRALQPEMPFAEAFAVFMQLRTGVSAATGGRVKKWSERTIERYQDYGDAFSLVYGRVPLIEFTDGHLCEYAERRAAEGASQNVARKETDMVVRVLRDAGLWEKTGAQFKAYELQRLPMVESDDQRALDRKQIKALMRVLAEKPEESQWVLYDSVVALYTCSSTNERRLAKIEDVQLAQRLFHVGPRQSKNKYRNRWIPLETDEVLYAFEWLLARAKEKGATEPHHYLYPKRLSGPANVSRYDREELYEKVWSRPLQSVAKEYGISDMRMGSVCRSLAIPLPGRGAYWRWRNAGKPSQRKRPELPAFDATAAEYDPKQPMTRWSLSQQFEGVGGKIGVDDLRAYDLRHTAMSLLAAAGTPIDVILSFGGQVSEKMRKHYTTISMMAKRETQPLAWKDFRLLNEVAPTPPKKPPANVVVMPRRSKSA